MPVISVSQNSSITLDKPLKWSEQARNRESVCKNESRLKAACVSRGSLSPRHRFGLGQWALWLSWGQGLLPASTSASACCLQDEASQLGHHLFPQQRQVLLPRRACETVYWQVRSAWLTRLLQWQGYCLYQGKRKKELCVSRRKIQEVQRSGEVRTKQTSSHLRATKSMLICQTKEALQSCLTGKPPEKK